MTPKEKHIEFARASLELVKPSLASTFAQMAATANMTAQELETAIADRPAERARTQENEQLMSGSDGSIAGVTPRGDQWMRYNKAIRDRQAGGGKKEGSIDIAFLQLLSDIERLNDELDGLRKDIAAYEAKFEAEYGADWRDDLASMYLSEEELAKLEGLEGREREQAIIEALSAKMLNPDGTIKDEYKGNEVAEYLVKLEEADQLVVKRDQCEERLERYLNGEINDLEQKDGMVAAVTAKLKETGLTSEFVEKASGREPEPELEKAKVAYEAQDVEMETDVNSASNAWNDFGI